MVDSLLEQFDANEDGILDFSEFMKSFVQARQDLGLFWIEQIFFLKTFSELFKNSSLCVKTDS